MYNFKQHVPGAVDGVDPYVFPFERIEELLSFERITRYIRPNFHKFSISYDKPYNGYGGRNSLMVESDEGRHWWCLGHFLDEDMKPITTQLDFLPEWIPVK